MRTPSVYSQEDPLAAALQPDPGETDIEKQIRLRREAEARRISEQIDEEIRLERERLRRSKDDVKLLLLGQAESGKSTLLKQFQLMYKPHSLHQERSSWRAVIYFNVVHSIKHILATLEAWDDRIDEGLLEEAHSAALAASRSTDTQRPNTASSHANAGGNFTDGLSKSGTLHSTRAPYEHTSGITPISALRKRLMALVNTDDVLAERLTGGVHVTGSGRGGVFVRTGWQARTIENALRRARRKPGQIEEEKTYVDRTESDPLLQTVGNMLSDVRNDIEVLWNHPIVRTLIKRRKLKLDEWAEFFLRHISRIVQSDYVPTIDDILHARIQTMGVVEHVFEVSYQSKVVPWHLYDVGGARGQRHTWIPYFDDANAIIFVAPVSAFDQYLEEDPRTNRIDDSLQLFTQICSNLLLKSVHLVLFLNKTDLLRAKLDRGLVVRKYITSFGDRTNEYETVVQYFRAHFLQVHRRNNENRRVLYTHFTNVTDTKATQRIIANVRDSIFRGYLQSAALV